MKEQIGAFLQAQADTKVHNKEMMELQSRLSAQKVEASRLAYEAAKGGRWLASYVDVLRICAAKEGLMCKEVLKMRGSLFLK